MRLRTLMLAGCFFGAAGPAVADTELLMFEEAGCAWCVAWLADIGPIYPQTEYAAQAPLRQIDISQIPDSITLRGRVVFTPTFVLAEDGHEIARIEGYGGDELFWMQMTMLARSLPTQEPEEEIQ